MRLGKTPRLSWVENKKKDNAQSSYQKAIRLAKEVGIVQEEALAHELFGMALFEWGEMGEASMQIKQATALYRMWGAHRKAAHLEEYLSTLLTANR